MLRINQLISRLAAVWRDWTLGQRVGMVASVLASIGTVVGVIYWATRPEFVLLADRLTPTQAAEAVAILERDNITHQLNFSGSSISVSRVELSRARLAVGDIVGDLPAADVSSGAQTPWDPPAMQTDRLLRQQEARLAQSIMLIHGVRSATVHIGRSDPSPFLRDSSPSTASVVVDVKPGALLGAQQAQSIVALVSHAVEGLSPENVSVLDTDGRVLSAMNGPAADVAGRLDYRTRLEAGLASKAETMLNQMLGPGHATVRVSADVDFTETTRTETRFDPDSKVKKNETIKTISQTGAPRLSVGAAGTASNVTPTSNGSGSGNSQLYKEEETTTDFENPKTDETVRELPGRVKRLTVAAIVDLPQEPAAAGAPLPTAADVEAIIKQAVGFDALRQDEIQVVIAPLASTNLLQQQLVSATTWERYEQIARAASLGVGAIVASIVALLVLRRMRPIVIAAEDGGQLSREQLHRLMKVSQLARDNPDAAAKVLKAWMQPQAEHQQEPSRKSA